MISAQCFVHEKRRKSVIPCVGTELGVLESIFGTEDEARKFLAEDFQRRPVVVRGSKDRLTEIIDNFMWGLDVASILENTASENGIHCWLNAGDDKTSSMDSISVDQASVALKLHNAGHSLYCRASPELESVLVPKLLNELGIGVKNADSDRFSRGEIETFISKKSHVTEFHTDFQENFTFQLSGIKRWWFRNSTASAPMRGCTPHFGSKQAPSVVETQLKALRLGQPSFSAEEFTKSSAASGETSIVLGPGDVLYHPAGVWHRVECLEDSVAINVSLVGASLAELVGSAVTQMLCVDSRWRGPVRVGGLHEKDQMALLRAGEVLKAASDALKLLIPSDILTIRSIRAECDLPIVGGGKSEEVSESSNDTEESQDEGGDLGEGVFDVTDLAVINLPVLFTSARRFRLNPLAVLMSGADLIANGWTPPASCENLESEVAIVLVHINFGNEMLESVSRSLLAVPTEGLSVVHALSTRNPNKLEFSRDELSRAVTKSEAGAGAVGGGRAKKRRQDPDSILLRTLYGLYQCGVLTPLK